MLDIEFTHEVHLLTVEVSHRLSEVDLLVLCILTDPTEFVGDIPQLRPYDLLLLIQLLHLHV
jgi:hypothetical protein